MSTTATMPTPSPWAGAHGTYPLPGREPISADACATKVPLLGGARGGSFHRETDDGFSSLSQSGSARPLEVDLDLVRKYNVPGPRYTSYPPAPHFTDAIPTERLIQEIRSNNATARDLSLYFHLPFCQSLCWFCGCTTVITTDQRASGTYLHYLEKELALMAPLLNPKREVVQLHFGGGTPTFLAPDEIRALGQQI